MCVDACIFTYTHSRANINAMATRKYAYVLIHVPGPSLARAIASCRPGACRPRLVLLHMHAHAHAQY